MSKGINKRVWIGIAVGFVLVLLVGVGLVLFVFVKLEQTNLTKAPSYTADQYYSKATDQMSQGNYGQAQVYLQSALAQGPNNTYQSQLAVVDYQLKEYEASIAAYQKLVDSGQDKAFAENGIGNAYRDWGKPQLAEAAYRRAIEADKQYVAAYSNLAILLYQQGDKAGAKAILDQGIATTKEPDLSTLQKNLIN
jgi:tetratricopeptide (TPR) repeat protein